MKSEKLIDKEEKTLKESIPTELEVKNNFTEVKKVEEKDQINAQKDDKNLKKLILQEKLAELKLFELQKSSIFEKQVKQYEESTFIFNQKCKEELKMEMDSEFDKLEKDLKKLPKGEDIVKQNRQFEEDIIAFRAKSEREIDQKYNKMDSEIQAKFDELNKNKNILKQTIEVSYLFELDN